MYQIGG